MSKYKSFEREGYTITFYPEAYKKKPVITILSPGSERTSDFYLSGYVWRSLDSKKRVPKPLEHYLKNLHTELKEGVNEVQQ